MGGGRQREFDVERALDCAVRVFWQKGYLGTSLSELTEAMGISKPSLYSAFGNKEQLFIRATHYYMAHYVVQPSQYLRHTGLTLKQRLRNYLLAVLVSQTEREQPAGCYIALCASETGSEHMPAFAAKNILEARDCGEQTLTAFFAEEIEQGNLPKETDPAALALFVITLFNGTAALSRSGKSLAELERTLDLALKVLL